MPNHRFAPLAARLLRAGVAPRHVRRTVLELSAHVEDLAAAALARGASSMEARVEAERQIGTDDVLAARILAQPALKSWGYRRPAVVFGVAPVLLYALSFVLLCVVLVQAADILFDNPLAAGVDGRHAPGLLAVLAAGSRYFLLYGMPSLWCFAVMRYALERHLPWRWPALGIAATALLGAAINFDYVLPGLGTPGAISAGIGFSTEWNRLALFGARALLTSALAAGLCVAFRRIRAVTTSD
jgi:hypothetical protein